MEKQNGYENSLDLMLRNLGGNVDDFAKSGYDPNQQNWFLCQRPPSNYYEFLTENSSLVQKAPTHAFNNISVPVSDPCFIQPMSEYQTQLIYNNPGLVSGSKPAVSSPDMGAWKLNPYLYMSNSNNHKASCNLRCSEQYDEMDPLNKFNSPQNQTQTQSHSSLTQEPSGLTSNVSGSHRRTKVAASVNVTRQIASSTDRKRRERIAERMKALQQLLPNSVEGSQMAVMDEIIGYVKHLQLQMQELSQSKLGGEFYSFPPIFDEGDYHYTFHEQTMKEPVEVTFAKLLKVDTSAAIMFLESKGLYVKPMPLADRLQ